MEQKYFNKYIKYKNKYLELKNKNLIGGYQNDYSINFLWLNKDVNIAWNNQKYIFPIQHINITIENENEATNVVFVDFRKLFIIIGWIKKNPNSDINIWHDCSEAMVYNTLNLIKKMYNLTYSVEDIVMKFDKIDTIISEFQSRNRWQNNRYVRFNDDEKQKEFLDLVTDLNSIIKLDKESGLFEVTVKFNDEENEITNSNFYQITKVERLMVKINDNDYLIDYYGLSNNGHGPSGYQNKFPIYFKVDLIRVMILIQLVKLNPNKYAIYADLDTTPLDQNEMFTDKSIRILQKYGLALPRCQKHNFENSFHILAGKNLTCDKFMINSLEKIIIEFNIMKVINGYGYIQPETIFVDYRDMFKYYFAIILDKSIRFKNSNIFSEWFRSDIREHFYDIDYDKYRNLYNKKLLNKELLLNLDISKIYQFYTNTSDKKDILFEENLDDPLVKDYPVIDEWEKISPHGYEYNKKYIKL